MFKRLTSTAALLLAAAGLCAKSHEVPSPNGKLKAVVHADAELSYSILLDGAPVYENAAIAMITDRGALGKNAKLSKVSRASKDESIKTVWGLKSEIRDNYNEAEFSFENFSVLFRVYDDAVCYRFKTAFGGDMTVFDERADFPFPLENIAYAYPIKNFIIHFQQVFEDLKLSDFHKLQMAIAPLSVRGADGKIKTIITDSDVYDYPALNFHFPKGAKNLGGLFAKYPLELTPKGNALHPKSRADYIAKTAGTRAFPWRVVIVSDDDKSLLDNHTVYKLASPCKIEDVSWIRTGTCAWEWWHGANLEGVDFETGINDRTYRHYIDFAAKYKIPFMLFDGGWMDQEKLDKNMGLAGSSRVDVPALCAYAKERGVKIFVWVRSRNITDYAKAEEWFSTFNSWGVGGVKVDFVERDDQQAMNFYADISAIAAKHRLLVNWHGCPKTTGLYRAYPNVVNEEGVRGGELNRMTDKLTPAHNVSLLFTRMLAGPFDYTPGAMRNTAMGKKDSHEFAPSTLWPMSRGTRAHQVAMYIMYYEPLKMLVDSPTEYEKYPALTKFIAECPTVWDDTVPLAAEFNKYGVIARRKGRTWYVGAMTDWTQREVEIRLDFLDDGEYAGTVVRDTVNSNRLAKDYKMENAVYKKGDSLKIKMAKGGGFALKLEKR